MEQAEAELVQSQAELEVRVRERTVELAASEEQYRLLFEKNPDPMWVFDPDTRAFLAVNEAAVNQYGYSREEFVGMTIDEIRPAEDVPRLAESYKNRLSRQDELVGSGANSGREGFRLGSAWLSGLRWPQAASAAFHNSDIVAFRPPSLPVLYCPFLIFSANSIPEIVTAAFSNRLNPSMGRVRCFTLWWSCSTRLFKYWLERTFTRRGSSPSSFISRTARCEAA